VLRAGDKGGGGGGESMETNREEFSLGEKELSETGKAKEKKQVHGGNESQSRSN